MIEEMGMEKYRELISSYMGGVELRRGVHVRPLPCSAWAGALSEPAFSTHRGSNLTGRLLHPPESSSLPYLPHLCSLFFERQRIGWFQGEMGAEGGVVVESWGLSCRSTVSFLRTLLEIWNLTARVRSQSVSKESLAQKRSWLVPGTWPV